MLRFFEKLTPPFPDEEPQQPPKGIIAFCRHYSKGMGWPLLFMSCTVSAMALLEVWLFGFLGNLVDWLGQQDPQQFLEQQSDTLWLVAIVLLLVLPALALLHSLLVHQALLGNYPMAIRWQAHRYLLKQSLSFYQNDFAGRVATKVMQTSLAVRESVMKLLDVMVYVSVYFGSMVFLIAELDWRLMLPMLCWLLAYITIQGFFVPRLKQVSSAQADARSDMTGRIVDSYTNISTIKLFSHSRRESQYAKDSMQGFLGTVYQQMRLATGMSVSVQLLNFLLIFSVTALSIYLWLQQSISVGAIAIVISMALRLHGMAQWIMWELTMLFENIGTVADGISTLSQPQQILDAPNAPDLNVSQGIITFQDVTFGYDTAQHNTTTPVLKHFNLTIQSGERIGIVGRSGAGKSTLVNLLLRFYDTQQGCILIDGQPIQQIAQDSLRANIGMVTQDTSLLHRSVRDNILYGRPDASEEDMIRAAKEAEAHEFILALSDPKGNTGYDAQVGERGVKLSGGQRQRIAIARVLLKNAPILILDEATSALDSEVEAAIQQSLYQLMKHKTVIAIAHRLSTIAAMDRLIVLDQGHIVEQGSHKQLIEQQGLYAQLWKHQTGGFIGDC